MIRVFGFPVYGDVSNIYEDQLEMLVEGVLEYEATWAYAKGDALYFFSESGQLRCMYLEDSEDDCYAESYKVMDDERKSLPLRYRNPNLLPRNYKGA